VITTKKLCPLLAMNPKSRSLEKLFVRMEERKKIE